MTRKPTTRRRRTLTPRDLVARWSGHVTEKTLRNWRAAGKGPPHWHTDGGRVVYDLRDVIQFERTTNLRRSPTRPARNHQRTTR